MSGSTMGPLGAAAYTKDGAPVARERFYELACDPARSVVVEACAGAGKTWMLVSRILRALLDGARPQDIVAITFTRKAAGEMRARLNEWLHEFAHCDDAGRVLALRQRGLPEAEALALAPRLAGLQQRLLQDARPVEIRTFHAWFSQLLRAAPLELLRAQGLSPELQLLEDESDLMPELWQRFHAAVLADEAQLAIYRELSLVHGRNKLTNWLTAAFEKRVELTLAHRHGRLLDSMPTAAEVVPEFAAFADPIEAFGSMRADLQALAIELGQGKNKKQKDAAVALEMALTAPRHEAMPVAEWDLAAMSAARAALFTKTGTLVKALGDSPLLLELGERLDRLQLALEQDRARVWHQQMCALALTLLAEFERLKRERGIVDMNDLERGALALLGDVELSGWVQERLDSQVRHLLIDEFQDTSPLQWHALHAWLSGYVGAGGGVSGQRPPSVFIVGDPKQSIYRFRRAEPRVFAAARDFVREGLDGVLLACDHTRRNSVPVLAAVNAVFEQASLAQQYSDFRAHTTESSGGDPLDGVFFLAGDGAPDDEEADGTHEGEVDVEEEGAGRDADTWRPSLTEPRREPELHRREAEAARIAASIEQLLAGGRTQPGDIFVLARKREGLRVLAQVLKGRGIPHAAPEDMALLDAPDVRDLLALLDALASSGHQLSLAHALRSPLFGASEADLLWLAATSGSVRWLGQGDDTREVPAPVSAPVPAMADDSADDTAPKAPITRSWWEVLMQADPADLSPVLARARELLSGWASMAVLRSPHDLLDAIVHEGELMARLAAAVPASERRARLHAVEALLALALELDGGRYAGLYGFVRALKGRALKLAAPAEPDAVQLLTVHGAKGLEAQVVILMDAEAGPARAESMALAISWPVHEPVPRTVAFLVSEAKPPPSLQPLLDDEKEQRQREELNALYVAMTRARHRLVLSRTPARRQSASASWWARVSPQAEPLALPEPDANPPTAQADAERAVVRLKVLPRVEPLPASAETVQVSDEAEADRAPADARAAVGQSPEEVEESAALGEALHRVLEWHSGPQGRAHALDRLMAAAAQMYGLDARRDERLQRSVKAILSSRDCAPFFDASVLAWHGNEVPLSWQGHDMRLDRLVCREDGAGARTWWVLDYKLHPAPQRNPDYLLQLWRYREAVSTLQPGDAVRCAFITGQGRLIDCTEAVAGAGDLFA